MVCSWTSYQQRTLYYSNIGFQNVLTVLGVISDLLLWVYWLYFLAPFEVKTPIFIRLNVKHFSWSCKFNFSWNRYKPNFTIRHTLRQRIDLTGLHFLTRLKLFTPERTQNFRTAWVVHSEAQPITLTCEVLTVSGDLSCLIHRKQQTIWYEQQPPCGMWHCYLLLWFSYYSYNWKASIEQENSYDKLGPTCDPTNQTRCLMRYLLTHAWLGCQEWH